MNAPWLRLIPAFLRARIEGRFNFQAVLANTGWLMADRLLRIVVGLLVGAWVARYLGPEQYGELSYALALTAFFYAVANLGLDGIVVRDIAREPAQAPVILGTALRLRLVFGLLAWVGAIAAIVLLRPGDMRGLVLVALVAAGVVFQSADTVDLWFQSQFHSRRTVLAKLLALLASNGFKIALILKQAPIEAFAVVQLFEVVFGALALTFAYRKFPTAAHWRGTWISAGRLLGESWPLLLGSLSIVVYMRIDQLMLRAMVGDRELGIFSAVLPFSEVWNFIPTTVCASVAPLITRKKAASEAEYYSALHSLFTVLAWVAIVISVVVALGAVPLVRLLLGTGYERSASVLAIHVFSIIPVYLGVAQGIWIVNEGKSCLALMKTSAGAVVNVSLNLLLIPKFGALGAAVATVVSYFVSAVLSNFLLAPKIYKLQLSIFRLRNVRLD